MTGQATRHRVAEWRTRLAALIYPGKLAYIERSHQGTASSAYIGHDPGSVRCNYCGLPSREWKGKPCRAEAGKLTEPQGFRV